MGGFGRLHRACPRGIRYLPGLAHRAVNRIKSPEKPRMRVKRGSSPYIQGRLCDTRIKLENINHTQEQRDI